MNHSAIDPTNWPTFNEAYGGSADVGTRFHTFVGELLAPDHFGLSSFIAPGKDGAIDAFHQQTGTVWECKFVGEDGYEAAASRWREVSARLLSNLLDARPRPGQRQYAPWYETKDAITRYIFCSSAWIGNRSSELRLTQSIESTFRGLSTRIGLLHLAALTVEVWTWERLSALLATNTALRLRWFGTGRLPIGLQHIQEWRIANSRRGFHAYLLNETLAYSPLQGKGLAPEELFENIAGDRSKFATVIHGRGGAGKSRLMAEIGQEAERHGWVVVFAVANEITPAILQELARLCVESQCLLLIDYVERCTDFDALVQRATALNDVGSSIHLLGTCRDSHVSTLDTHGLRLTRVASDLSKTVEEILRQRPGLSDLASACAQVPVFAAFLCQLHDHGKLAEITELRHSGDFARWLQQHIARVPPSLAGPSSSFNTLALAELLASLPASSATVEALVASNSTVRMYYELLQAEGWLIADYLAPQEFRWSVAHDIVADGAVLAAVSTPGDATARIRKWFETARTVGSVSTLLRSFQRIRGEPIIGAVLWNHVFAPADGQWNDWVEHILRTDLIPPQLVFSWLDALPLQPEYLITLPGVHRTIGSLLRICIKDSKETSYDIQIELVKWVDLACEAFNGKFANATIDFRNDVIAKAILWKPARYAQHISEWLEKNSARENARFVIRSWVTLANNSLLPDSEQALDAARGWLNSWFSQNAKMPSASGVYQTWVDAKGDETQLRVFVDLWLKVETNLTSYRLFPTLRTWLQVSHDASELPTPLILWLKNEVNLRSHFTGLSFIYWLDAGGNANAISPWILEWLTIDSNHTRIISGMLYRAIGDRHRGLPDWISPFAFKWIQRWSTSPLAVFPLKWISSHYPLDSETFLSILRWCDNYPNHEDAVYRLSRAITSAGGISASLPNVLPVIIKVLRPTAALQRLPATGYWLISSLVLVSEGFYNLQRFATNRVFTDELAKIFCQIIRAFPEEDLLTSASAVIHQRLLTSAWPELMTVAMNNGESIDPSLVAGFRQLALACKGYLGWAGNLDSRMANILTRLSQRMSGH